MHEREVRSIKGCDPIWLTLLKSLDFRGILSMDYYGYDSGMVRLS